MCKPPDYEAVEAVLWRENAEEVVPLLEKGDENLMKKITTYCTTFDHDADEVIEEIYNNPMFAATFAKKPNRQGMHEKIAGKWLNDNLNTRVVILPKAGSNALYITSTGKITRGNVRNASKSLDFEWNIGKYKFYGMHKYTRGVGGAQDNQFREMLDALRKFSNVENPTIVFIAIADGSYYTQSKMSQLTRETRSEAPRSYAAHIEEVPAIVEEYR